MKREIKFRVWEKGANEMLYPIWETKEVNGGHHNDYWYVSKVTGFYSSLGWVLRSEGFKSMQYTGLKDKNDKEIYEGDIVEKKEGRGVVEFHYFGTWHAKEPLTGRSLPLGGDLAHVEIIGNIYENPELLKAQT